MMTPLEHKHRQLHMHLLPKTHLAATAEESVMCKLCIGSQRFATFVKQYILQIESKEKKHEVKLNTFCDSYYNNYQQTETK